MPFEPFAPFDLHVRDDAARPLFARVPVAVALTERLNRLPYAEQPAIRTVWSELTGQAVDETFRLIPPFFTEHGLHIRVGRNVFLNQNCTVMDMAGVELGDDVMVGPNVQLITVAHGLRPADRRTRITGGPIRVGAGVWIAAGATVLLGVTIGENSVVAAGSVVTRDVPAGVLVAGVPARVVRGVDE
ncbi:sugar O-acetyltransferase [Spongisporangium articulatum]|uniref:Sugar O-acetyltransferase n=1 Tax=Spongisporangium articulatum TaxID=3362603 RepID=A0ABW8AN92_9ACTN